MRQLSTLEAAKIVLGRALFVHATVKERDQGLFGLPLQDKFCEAIMILREQKEQGQLEDKRIDEIGMAIIPAAIRLVEVWDANGKDWLKK